MPAQRQSPNGSKKTKLFECSEMSKIISKSIKYLHTNKEFFDLIIISNDNVQLQAHSAVVCASSDYLKEIVHNMESSTSKPFKIRINEFHSIALKTVLKFMYTGSVQLLNQTVRQVLLASDQFKVKPLIDNCLAFMIEELNSTSYMDNLLLAKKRGYKELEKKCFSFACTHFKEIVSRNDYLEMDFNILDDILSSDELVVSSERFIVNSILMWLEHKRQLREKHYIQLLARVRYQFLTQKFIAEIADQLCINLECRKLIQQWLEWHVQIEKRPKVWAVKTKPRKGYETAKLEMVIGHTLNDLSVQTYYPTYKVWTLKLLPSTFEPIGAVSTIFNEGLVFVVGGIKTDSTRTNEVLFFNMETEETGLLPSMKHARSHCKLAIHNGNLYVIGGAAVSQDLLYALKVVERYNFKEKKWEEMAPLLNGLTPSSRLAIVNDYIYVVDARTTQCYDTNQNIWTYKAAKSVKSCMFGLASVDEHLYAVGGLRNNWEEIDTVERYHPSSDEWHVVGTISSTRHMLVCLGFQKSLIVVGGMSKNEFISKVEEFKTETNELKTLPPFLTN